MSILFFFFFFLSLLSLLLFLQWMILGEYLKIWAFMEACNPNWTSSSKQLLFTKSYCLCMQGISFEVHIIFMSIYLMMTVSTTYGGICSLILSVLYLFYNCKWNSKNIIKSIFLKTCINFSPGDKRQEANVGCL